MGEQESKRSKKHICAGLLAHVDAGKTTLSEAMLYTGGSIRRMGRVDDGDAFFDTHDLERSRGITIFSKQAVLEFENVRITLMDTPGHVDFSAEMERTLQVLDYAVLVISGTDGVQGHTQTLWNLLKKYKIPVFLFINKMDLEGTNSEIILKELKERLDDGCIDFGQEGTDSYLENIAMCEEEVLEHFIKTNSIETEDIKRLILNRKLFPCFFGSARKLEGVLELMRGFGKYTREPVYSEDFGAKVFKIARDDQGSRLTFLKITGGSLKVKAALSGEKVNQIRIYSGEKYQLVNEAYAGCVCAVTGPVNTYPGQGLGIERPSELPLLEPVLAYGIQLPSECQASVFLPKLRQLEEEEPELHIIWDEQKKEITAHVMGEIQIEILKSLIWERFGVLTEFGTGAIVYKETITNTVEGVGHFEPLRHYAEVHLIMEPGERGSGLVFESHCSEDVLDRNWQRLILTHLEEKEHRGVLIGAAITDMKITLVAGRAHLKHTEGGDFREATYRAVRQGLREAESLLLEPYYEFRLEVPEKNIGRAMADVEKMAGTFHAPETRGEMAILTGSAPVAAMREYQREVTAYTKGLGRLSCAIMGYQPCCNSREIIEKAGYCPENDLENPTGSVFCAHGAGFIVNWDQVKDYMHMESILPKPEPDIVKTPKDAQEGDSREDWIGTEEIDAILAKTFYANRRDQSAIKKGFPQKKDSGFTAVQTRTFRKPQPQDDYLLVDGYNIVYAWEELRELAKDNIDGARGRLLDLLCNYQGVRQCSLIVVFDAYRVKGHEEEFMDYNNIHVVYTKEAETADQYIEKFAHENNSKYKITVATSDGMEQIIIRSQNCGLLSARELEEEVKRAGESAMENYKSSQQGTKSYLFDSLSGDVAQQVENIRNE